MFLELAAKKASQVFPDLRTVTTAWLSHCISTFLVDHNRANSLRAINMFTIFQMNYGPVSKTSNDWQMVNKSPTSPTKTCQTCIQLEGHINDPMIIHGNAVILREKCGKPLKVTFEVSSQCNPLCGMS